MERENLDDVVVSPEQYSSIVNYRISVYTTPPTTSDPEVASHVNCTVHLY